MENSIRTSIEEFVSAYQTLVIATEHEGQPYATRIFYVEGPMMETTYTLYATVITSSRKLANLRRNPQVGIFIGPDQPSTWLEATARARVLDDDEATHIRAKLADKSATAAAFISVVPTVAIALDIRWLRITDLKGSTPYTEATFELVPQGEKSRL